MSKYRTSRHDAPDRVPVKPVAKPAELPPSRIPVIDEQGRRRGHVGFKASEATAARFGVCSAKLTKIGGKLAWAGEANANARRRQEINRAQRVKANKGSVTFRPTRPDRAVRPEEGDDMRHANGRFRNQRTHPGIGHAHPHAEAAKNLAGQIDHTRVNADLGTAPKPKRAFTTAPQIHSGMMGKARSDGTHFAGVGGQDLSRYDANGPGPLSGAPRGKTLGTVRPVPGQRSRTNEGVESHADKCQHGADMLAGAVCGSTRLLPATVKED